MILYRRLVAVLLALAAIGVAPMPSIAQTSVDAEVLLEVSIGCHDHEFFDMDASGRVVVFNDYEGSDPDRCFDPVGQEGVVVATVDGGTTSYPIPSRVGLNGEILVARNPDVQISDNGMIIMASATFESEDGRGAGSDVLLLDRRAGEWESIGAVLASEGHSNQAFADLREAFNMSSDGTRVLVRESSRHHLVVRDNALDPQAGWSAHELDCGDCRSIPYSSISPDGSFVANWLEVASVAVGASGVTVSSHMSRPSATPVAPTFFGDSTNLHVSWWSSGGCFLRPVTGAPLSDVGECRMSTDTNRSWSLTRRNSSSPYHLTTYSKASGYDDVEATFEVPTANGADSRLEYVTQADGLSRVLLLDESMSDGSAQLSVVRLTDEWLTDGIDSDGDSLPDSWELYGYDADRDGVIDLDLPALGANPYRRNLFVQLDVTNSSDRSAPNYALEQEALDMVVEAFAAMPITNPDGSQGIDIYIEQRAINETDVSLPTVPNGFSSALQNLADRHMDADRHRVFHYAVIVHEILGDSGRVFGRSGGIHAQNFALAGDSREDPLTGHYDGGGDDNNTTGSIAQYQARLFMHELGHNLNLRHGGTLPDGSATGSPNHMPHYVSAMNYNYRYGIPLMGPHADPVDPWVLRYSTVAHEAIDPANVNETLNLDEGSPFGIRWRCATATDDEYMSPNPGVAGFVPLDLELSAADFYDFDCDGSSSTSAAMVASVYTTSMTATDDMAAIRFDGGTIGDDRDTPLPRPITPQQEDEVEPPLGHDTGFAVTTPAVTRSLLGIATVEAYVSNQSLSPVTLDVEIEESTPNGSTVTDSFTLVLAPQEVHQFTVEVVHPTALVVVTAQADGLVGSSTTLIRGLVADTVVCEVAREDDVVVPYGTC